MAKLKEEKILEEWSYLIEGAEGKSEQVFKLTEKNIDKVQPPQVELEREMIRPVGTLVGFFTTKKREFLVASNKYLKGYKIYLGARDYGKQLMVSWYLIGEAGVLAKLADIMAKHWILGFIFLPFYLIILLLQMIWKKSVTLENMNLFDREEATAYITTVHHAVLEAVADIMKGLNQDPSKIDKRTKGFLNIT
ncbi:hypothetical protein J7J95_03030 [bacterium]|nr:hypothetical protein [bacterium]